MREKLGCFLTKTETVNTQLLTWKDKKKEEIVLDVESIKQGVLKEFTHTELKLFIAYAALKNVSEKNIISPSELSEVSGLSRATVYKSLEMLSEKGVHV